MTGLKPYSFEDMVWQRGELLCVSVRREAFQRGGIRGGCCRRCRLTSSFPSTWPLCGGSALCAWGSSLVRCHRVDQNNMCKSKHTTLAGEQLDWSSGWDLRTGVHLSRRKPCSSRVYVPERREALMVGKDPIRQRGEVNKASEKWRLKDGFEEGESRHAMPNKWALRASVNIEIMSPMMKVWFPFFFCLFVFSANMQSDKPYCESTR